MLSSSFGTASSTIKSDRFLIIHGGPDDPLNRVCAVNVERLTGTGPSTNRNCVIMDPRLSYGRSPGGAAHGLIEAPRHLAVDTSAAGAGRGVGGGMGFVYVTDVGNCRVVILELETLRRVADIDKCSTASQDALDGDKGEKGNDSEDDEDGMYPIKICLDTERRQLYVAYHEYSSGAFVAGHVTVYRLI
jgi:hypothetical protein